MDATGGIIIIITGTISPINTGTCPYEISEKKKWIDIEERVSNFKISDIMISPLSYNAAVCRIHCIRAATESQVSDILNSCSTVLIG